MKWNEIISVRTTRAELDLVTKRIWEIINQAGEASRDGAPHVRVYHRPEVDTDVSVHLYHVAPRGAQPDLSMGVLLIGALKGHGMVDRTLWMQVHDTRES